MTASFDFVVVGGGSAGATIASRLTEAPNISVCLLEAGGRGESLLVRVPLGAAAMLQGYGKINNWALKTVPQPGLNGRRGYQPRGRALGGSSAINAMLYVRGQRQDYDGWADLGCDGWDWDSVLPYFKRSENNVNGASDAHGNAGPLHVSNQKAPRPISLAYVQANSQRQIPQTEDFNTGDNEGASLYQCTQFHSPQRNGERCSAAAAFLHPAMDRPNLSVITRTQATRILFDGKRAVGVEYCQGRRTLQVRAEREVVLSAGAFGSPHLLMLSGVGRAEDIRQHGISIVHDLPGVGQNLQDHIDIVLACKTTDRDNLGFGLRPAISILGHALQWRRNGISMLASTIAEAGSFFKTDPNLDRPDVQTHFVIAVMDDHARRLHRGHGYSCHVSVLRPYSRGEVLLQGPDPMLAPGIDPRFLSDRRDLRTLVKGARMTREILHAPAMKPFIDKELYGMKDAMTDADWELMIRKRADTVYHPAGTCKMGVDDMAVVDPKLKVRGLSGLRVADASIMPLLISGNTNGASIMIGEKCADLLLAEAR
jgi:choline dehydrogenase-like flavoprotein